MNPPRRPGRGFTLIELLVVVGVIAILSLMALPSYLDRAIRKQIEESLPIAEVAKGPIAIAWATLQDFPADNAAALLPPADKIVGNHVSAVTVKDGAIHITFGNNANGALKGRVLTLRPAVVEDTPVVPVAWVCGNAAVPAKMTAKGTNATTVPNGYLPFSCMGKKP